MVMARGPGGPLLRLADVHVANYAAVEGQGVASPRVQHETFASLARDSRGSAVQV
eukprot:CAMPEP_0185562310 /NCGR_PEP_ID=MMETSP1381-20130426/61105_1 /TAXON_ID=298111 /ORGANISM="Pavlova sp., Strain CCMP459" /LENGTH=54 /DNA_ID=CAMNT_0028176141 /DNA_START=143 /DNA_END=304 /DNA_ORIENTATION=-